MILRMTKVEILGPKRYFQEIVSLLHSMGTLHIENLSRKIAPGDMFLRQMEMDPRSLRRKQDFEELLVKAKGILKVLEVPEEDVKEEREKFYEELLTQEWTSLSSSVRVLITKIEERVRELAVNKDKLESELSSLKTYESAIEKIQPLAKQLVTLEGFETIALLIEQKHKPVLELIRDELAKITKNQFELISADIDENTTSALIVFNKTYADPVRRFIYDENVSELRLPPEVSDKPFDVALEFLKDRKAKIPYELEKVKKELKTISSLWYARLSAARDVLQDQLEEIKTVPQFGETAFTFLVSAWMPKKHFKKAKQSLKEKFGDKALIREVEVSHEEWEDAPVIYENPRFAKPFEVLMRLLPPPRYGTIDPTPLMALFFPIFFGLMVGDIGYGLLILAMAWALKRKFKGDLFVHDIGAIFTLCGISTIVFGGLFGEFFGELSTWGVKLRDIHWELTDRVTFHFPVHRAEANIIKSMLILAVGIGVGHIFLGLVLGMVNALREKSRKHLLEKSGMFLALFAIVLMLVGVAKILPSGFGSIGVVAFIIGVVLLMYGAGFIGIIEIVSGIGNILSYLRLTALGIASVLLAMVANELGDRAGASNVFIGILIAGLLHLLNLALGIFSPSIQSLRRGIAELFRRFYRTERKFFDLSK